MAVILEDVNPSLIPNTTMVKGIVNGVHRNYRIQPADGYVLHDKASDYEDPMEGQYHATFATGECSCPANYDFTPVQTSYVDKNGITILVTAYGAEREFYAVPADSPPEMDIYGADNDHEVI